MSRPEEYKIEKTVWRSGRKNDFGDELVVTEGYVNNQFAYIMAWEVKTERPETVSWNGEVSWFPRMYWVDNIPPGHIKVHNYSMGKDYLIKEDRHYKVIDGRVYIEFVRDTDNNLYHPTYTNVTYNSSAKTRAIEYVLWFNENQRQLDTYNRLLSTSKQAKKRRRKRANKQINITND